jgi:hypothetical protein
MQSQANPIQGRNNSHSILERRSSHFFANGSRQLKKAETKLKKQLQQSSGRRFAYSKLALLNGPLLIGATATFLGVLTGIYKYEVEEGNTSNQISAVALAFGTASIAFLIQLGFNGGAIRDNAETIYTLLTKGLPQNWKQEENSAINEFSMVENYREILACVIDDDNSMVTEFPEVSRFKEYLTLLHANTHTLKHNPQFLRFTELLANAIEKDNLREEFPPLSYKKEIAARIFAAVIASLDATFSFMGALYFAKALPEEYPWLKSLPINYKVLGSFIGTGAVYISFLTNGMEVYVQTRKGLTFSLPDFIKNFSLRCAIGTTLAIVLASTEMIEKFTNNTVTSQSIFNEKQAAISDIIAIVLLTTSPPLVMFSVVTLANGINSFSAYVTGDYKEDSKSEIAKKTAAFILTFGLGIFFALTALPLNIFMCESSSEQLKLNDHDAKLFCPAYAKVDTVTEEIIALTSLYGGVYWFLSHTINKLKQWHHDNKPQEIREDQFTFKETDNDADFVRAEVKNGSIPLVETQSFKGSQKMFSLFPPVDNDSTSLKTAAQERKKRSKCYNIM